MNHTSLIFFSAQTLWDDVWWCPAVETSWCPANANTDGPYCSYAIKSIWYLSMSSWCWHSFKIRKLSLSLCVFTHVLPQELHLPRSWSILAHHPKTRLEKPNKSLENNLIHVNQHWLCIQSRPVSSKSSFKTANLGFLPLERWNLPSRFSLKERGHYGRLAKSCGEFGGLSMGFDESDVWKSLVLGH